MDNKRQIEVLEQVTSRLTLTPKSRRRSANR